MSKFLRKRDQRNLKQLYIFCEGAKTEKQYFEDLKKDLRLNIVNIEIFGTGCNTQSVVECASDKIKEIKKELANGGEIDFEVWVVFDEDTTGAGRFDNAIKSAKSNNFKVAYSNECFELWYLLHFHYLDAAIGRDDYFEKIIPLLKTRDPKIKITNWRKDGKKLRGIYKLLEPLQKIAIKNSKNLYKKRNSKVPISKQKPSTTVHLLVERLNELK